MDERQTKALDEMSVDITYQVPEVVDGNNHPGDTRSLDGRLIDPRRNQRFDALPQLLRRAAAGRQLGCDRCKDVATMEGRARPGDAKARELRGIDAHDAGVWAPADARGQQSDVGSQKNKTPHQNSNKHTKKTNPNDHNNNENKTHRKILE